jgi:hypothetical protein
VACQTHALPALLRRLRLLLLWTLRPLLRLRPRPR